MVIENKEYNIIFLDVDGPLVKENAELHPEETVRAIMNQEGFPKVESELAKRICYDSIKRLKEILNYKEDTIIIETSLWKYKGQEQIDLINILKFYDVEITGLAPSVFENLSENRGKEILDSLAHINVKSFVVLDDWPDIQGEEYIHKHLVKIDPNKAITDEDVERAKNVLDIGLEKGFLEIIEEAMQTGYDDVENAGLTSHIETEETVLRTAVLETEITS